jgi:hypothetical protein
LRCQVFSGFITQKTIKNHKKTAKLGNLSPFFWLKLGDSHKGETQKTPGNPGNPENYRN